MSLRRLLFALPLLACTESTPPPPDGPIDHAFQDVPTTVLLETGVTRETLRIEGTVPPANPITHEETPTELNATQVLRYRQEPAAPARSIVVAMPGFLAGGGSFDQLARNLVKRGIVSGEPIEVWVIDRRGNALEDLRGMNTAEATNDPEIANQYYFGTDTIGGEPFAGFLDQSEVSYMSEWGLETHIEDVRRVISLVPAELRRGHVFLMGHSLGASFTEAYASWRFADGTRAIDELAGVVQIDGLLSGTPLSQSDYENGASTGGFSLSGVNGIRDTDRFTTLPFLGQDVYLVSEIAALRARKDPNGVVADSKRDEIFGFLLGVNPVPPMSNEAVLGFGFDEDYCQLAFAASSFGEATGGSIEPYQSLFGGQILHPTDPTATYTWVDAADTNPPELSSISLFAEAMSQGNTNFFEWYFPTRLALDLAAIGGLELDAQSYQVQEGLRATEAATMDAPFLGIAAALSPVTELETVRSIFTQPIGAGRPQAGATRQDTAGFELINTSFEHVDPLTAFEGPDNPVPAAIEAFLLRNSEVGTVDVP